MIKIHLAISQLANVPPCSNKFTTKIYEMLPPLCNPTIIRVTKSIETPKTHENKVGQTLC